MSQDHSNIYHRWPADGHDHHDVSPSDIYVNGEIRNFLNDNNKLFIIATKGMGKTLLMRVKRGMLRNYRSADTEPMLVIPSENAEVDTPVLGKDMPRNGFQDINLWSGLWQISILLSVLTHINERYVIKDTDLLVDVVDAMKIDDNFKEIILEYLSKGHQFLPSHFLTLLINAYSENDIRSLADCASLVVGMARNLITSGVVVLIDAFDQTLTASSNCNLEAWKNGQLGLAKAAHALFTSNHHLKVICTLRQEAWSGFVDVNKQVMGSHALLLTYSKADLAAMFAMQVAQYTNYRSISEFVGGSEIRNMYCKKAEDVFTYIYRHSIGTPRSLAIFGAKLDARHLGQLPESERDEELRRAVDDAACSNAYDYLVSEKSHLLKTLTSAERVDSLLALIPSNVLPYETLREINEAFCCRTGLDSAHPFCELFNVGLLGYVKQDAVNGGFVQHFKKPFEFDWHRHEIIDQKALYLIHPALTSRIAQHYNVFINSINIIGCDQAWISNDGRDGVPKIFISYASEDVGRVLAYLTRLRKELDLLCPSEFMMDISNLVGGENIERGILSGNLDKSDIMLLFASRASLASKWVQKEWDRALNNEIATGKTQIIVIAIDDIASELPSLLSEKRAIMLHMLSNVDVAISDLARSIKVHLHRKMMSSLK